MPDAGLTAGQPQPRPTGVTGPGDPGADDRATTTDELPVWAPPSWEQIVTEHSPRVYRLAYRLTGNRADAEDLTQETFVRVFRSLHSYQPGNFDGWLHRITTNLFLDQARRRSRLRLDPIGEATERLPAARDTDEPERGFEHAHLDLDVQAALDALPPRYRAAVVLCDIEGLSYEEIAATLDIKMGTVRSRIHRARAMLREQLEHRRPAGATAPQPVSAGRA
ncbi:RNA polymerase sigma factor SigE [Georgenia muralis]|uniref:RNA polymerase sigma-70 factor (ECF subfamily) n=1 Tax=Georgenia muralis TaxID=154117 RepID=A0A3N4Z738_9MICO|nr:RNA polymerase sigma factor SigE [Georgenia muralis]RPF27646.1 RNA polymerase sigma-70 factor (ECF subfamily) [Georgenia muralis]